jgi:hypothetical protein
MVRLRMLRRRRLLWLALAAAVVLAATGVAVSAMTSRTAVAVSKRPDRAHGSHLDGQPLSTTEARLGARPGPGPTTPPAPTPKPTATGGRNPILGAYRGGVASGPAGLPGWERWSGVRSPYALDFTASGSWTDLTGPDWLLRPWRDTGRRLIYTVPMFPGPADRSFGGGVSLEACASGGYDPHWTTLAGNLVKYQLEDTIVRPGWEFNGEWYGWAARGHEQAYIGCFQHLVRAMRAVSGQRFQFVWNPNVGPYPLAAERVYPGNEFVDYVGIDIYNWSWSVYPLAAGAAQAQRRAAAEKVWRDFADGDHGLNFWAGFARAHGKPMTFPEWGLAVEPDGHGAGDDPYFVEQMVAFFRNPAHNVAWAMYFDVEDSRISSADTRYPTAAARYRQLMAAR